MGSISSSHDESSEDSGIVMIRVEEGPHCFGCDATFGEDYMDARLSPYVTNEEYVGTLRNVNKIINRFFWKRCLFNIAIGIFINMCLVVLTFGIISPLFSEFPVVPDHDECIASAGECPTDRDVDPEAMQCCKWKCCLPVDEDAPDWENVTCSLIEAVSQDWCPGLIELEGDQRHVSEHVFFFGAWFVRLAALVLGIVLICMLAKRLASLFVESYYAAVDGQLDLWRGNGLGCQFMGPHTCTRSSRSNPLFGFGDSVGVKIEVSLP